MTGVRYGMDIPSEERCNFSNGEPFNAEAVIWNFKRAASDEYPRQAFEFRDYVKEYEAVDDHTVKFILSKPDIFFAAHVAEVPMLEPKHSEEIGEEAIGSDIIGTGPYVFKSMEQIKKSSLKRIQIIGAVKLRQIELYFAPFLRRRRV